MKPNKPLEVTLYNAPQGGVRHTYLYLRHFMHHKHRKVSLEENLTSARERLVRMDSWLVELRERESTLQQHLQDITKKLDLVSERLSRLRATRKVRPGFLDSLLNLTEIPPDKEREIKSLEDDAHLLLGERQKYDNLLRGLRNTIETNREGIWRQRSRISGIERAAVRKACQEGELIELRAAAAANVKQNRRVGVSIRRGLTKQPWCPYCEGPLGENPHADHIYPVSKGGKSVPKNMVYVCPNCNALKRNLTLSRFVKKYQLDRSAIENRLEELGKEY